MTEDELMLEARKVSLEMIGKTGSEREATLMSLCKRMQAVGLREAAALVPTNWLDSLLSGPDSPLTTNKSTGRQIEKLLLKVKVRIESHAKEREQ